MHAVRAVWDAVKKVRSATGEPAKRFDSRTPQAGSLDSEALAKVLGAKAETQDGIVKFTIGREATMHGAKFAGSMGLTTWAAFSGSDSLAAMDGDFAMTATEVQPVLRALRKGGINIVAVHNHMVGETPPYFFVHFWGKGSSRQLADGFQAAITAQKNAPQAVSGHK